MTGEGGRDPIDADDDLYSALAARQGPWFLRDGANGDLIPVTREQLAQLLADRHRQRDNPGE